MKSSRAKAKRRKAKRPKDFTGCGQELHMQDSDRVGRERGLRNLVLAGDEAAWQTWYDQAFAGLYTYVCWRCAGLRDLADELVQETWLTAVRRVRAFDPERASFAAWLRGIAGNVIRNHLRKHRRSPALQTLNGQEVLADAPAAADAERIARALAALSERHEGVLRAKYLEQQPVCAIAEQWQETPKTIESLLSRAREAFRQAYLDLE
jgi:RNA polymerase sigma-70 factor (ECF subfamily)